MLFSKCSSLLFYIINVMCSLNLIIKVESYEKIYTDVFKNFTVANNVIVDLLKNYDNLKKIFKSEEMFHSYSSSLEVDKRFKVLSVKQKQKHRNRPFQKSIDPIHSISYPSTAIIYDSDSSHDQIPIEDTKALNNAKEVIIIRNKLKSQKVNVSKDNKDQYRSINDEYEETEDSNENLEEMTLEIPPENVVVLKPTKKNLNKKSEQFKKIQGYKIKHNVFGDKTRFSILRLSRDEKISNQKKNFTMLKRKSNYTRRIQRIIRSETFSPHSIWRDVVNKPVQLIQDSDPRSERSFDTQNKTNERITIIIFKESKERSKDDDGAKNEKNIFRSEYGDVCLQNPINKCNKAIKTVNKNVCKIRFKCKSEFITAFLANGKTGCEKEFTFKDSETPSTTKSPKDDKIEPISFRVGDERYQVNVRKLSGRSLPLQSVLRDKYERECQKQSRNKCIRACEIATEETCSKYSCNKEKSKALKKACNDECKIVFIIKKTSNSDSDTSDYSDSDSDSDSSSLSE